MTAEEAFEKWVEKRHLKIHGECGYLIKDAFLAGHETALHLRGQVYSGNYVGTFRRVPILGGLFGFYRLTWEYHD